LVIATKGGFVRGGLFRRSPFMLPIPGTSNLDHFEENLGGLSVNLTDDDVDTLTRLVPERA
jgi:aryl-alcohol dehydrogenase-like predicted oxidoreductase